MDAPLLTSNDPDWQAYQDADDDYYLAVAGDEVRKYCGWHLFPSRTDVVPKLRIGSHGVIMLPSLHVTAVAEVALMLAADQLQVLDPASYEWFRYGVVQPLGVFMPNGLTNFMPALGPNLAQVTFTHGYTDIPRDLKQVVFELAEMAATVAASNAKDIQTPGFRLQLTQAGGATLNPAQMNRLAPYVARRTG
ncbi:hypothetical protein [Mycolicibacterium sphagni]|uniref:hypothetical protein n=1 Tax=Mycolicibacterium sphagni TaxID=1786 RepID=UPI0021F2A43E|nr:hypothetical protein [Mycolicibacterium sphagni]MCV7174931.1 hypothetical protein [Mycolicibacterium sphagni]